MWSNLSPRSWFLNWSNPLLVVLRPKPPNHTHLVLRTKLANPLHILQSVTHWCQCVSNLRQWPNAFVFLFDLIDTIFIILCRGVSSLHQVSRRHCLPLWLYQCHFIILLSPRTLSLHVSNWILHGPTRSKLPSLLARPSLLLVHWPETCLIFTLCHRSPGHIYHLHFATSQAKRHNIEDMFPHTKQHNTTSLVSERI